jgi:hypothetical protein
VHSVASTQTSSQKKKFSVVGFAVKNLSKFGSSQQTDKEISVSINLGIVHIKSASTTLAQSRLHEGMMAAARGKFM